VVVLGLVLEVLHAVEVQQLVRGRGRLGIGFGAVVTATVHRGLFIFIIEG